MNISLIEPLGIPESILEEFSNKLKDRGHNFTYYNEKTNDVELLIQRSLNQDIVMIANNKYPSEVIRSSKNLKMIAVAFTGIDHVGLDACKENNVLVCNCAGYSNICVSEQVLGMTISLMRFFKTCDNRVRQGGTSVGLAGTEISGKRVGLIGCGQIGTMVARLFLAFGCEVVVYSRSEREAVKALGVKYVSLDELLSTSDIISLHVPNNASTRMLIGEKEIAKMKKSSLFINCARGPIVDNKALADALNEERISGAAIDVYDTEPPLDPSEPLLNAKNTLLTPHVAFLTKEAMLRRAKIEFDNVLAFLDGKPQNVCIL